MRAFLHLSICTNLALSACAALTARGTEPIYVGTSKSNMSAAAVCIVRGLNSIGGFTHSISIIEPDRVLEVAPQQTITIGAERYFVRITAGEPIRIELFNTLVGVGDKLKTVISRC